MKTRLAVIILTLLLIPTFWRMLRPGIYSMHDFHVFRLYEFDKCVKDLQLPCRWAPDSGREYGEPMFNFYTQLPYLPGELFHLLGLSILNATKAAFALTLIASALTMFLVAKQIWRDNWAAILVGLIYIYAPYRAVDVWVRGALPEAMAFIFFPLIIYFFNKLTAEKGIKNTVWFSLSLVGLVLTHNLSALMFLIFFLIWVVFKLGISKSWWLLTPKFVLSTLLVVGLTAFYILPVVFESKYIGLQITTQGYYDFRNHFTNLNQLLITRFWGYGGSTWGPNDGMSLSVGHIQWLLPMLILFYVLIKYQGRIKKIDKQFLILFINGWLFVYLTHSRADFIWEKITAFRYIQFPWRFLSMAVFCFALASGYLTKLLPASRIKITIFLIILLLLSLNIGYFFEDLWYNWSDDEFFSGSNYQTQISSALYDYWPTPARLAPSQPPAESAMYKLIEKKSNVLKIELNPLSQPQEIRLPVVYFPGWQVLVDGKQRAVSAQGDYGLISFSASPNDKMVTAKFSNTPVRWWGNVISGVTAVIVLVIIVIS